MKIHMVLTENERNIIALKNNLKPTEFSKLVTNILIHKLRGETLIMPISFEVDIEASRTDVRITIDDSVANAFIKKFELKKGNISTAVKIEIDKFIRKNLRKPQHEYITLTYVKKILDSADDFITHQNNKTTKNPNKHIGINNALQDSRKWIIKQLNKAKIESR